MNEKQVEMPIHAGENVSQRRHALINGLPGRINAGTFERRGSMFRLQMKFAGFAAGVLIGLLACLR